MLTGACYVEMALTAASTVLGRPPRSFALRDVTLHQPLPLAEHIPVTTTFTESDRVVKVHTRDEDGWVLHCDLVVSDVDTAAAEPWPREDNRRPRCPRASCTSG